MDIIIKIHNKGEGLPLFFCHPSFFLFLKKQKLCESEQCKPTFGHVSWVGKRQLFDVFLGIPRKTSNTQPYFSF